MDRWNMVSGKDNPEATKRNSEGDYPDSREELGWREGQPGGGI